MLVEKKDDSGDSLTYSLLVEIENALSDFLESLKQEYDNSEEGLMYVSVYSIAFLRGPLFIGALKLHDEDKESIANKTMQTLSAILTSYQGLKVDEAALEFRITILSRKNVVKYKKMVEKKRKLPRNILGDSDDENELVGSLEPPNKRLKCETKKADSLLPLPLGFKNNENAFRNNCLLASIGVGVLYHEAQMEDDPKKRQAKERMITDINSKDKKNQITRQNLAGKKILQKCRELIFGIDNVHLEGPHSYKLAKEIALKHNLRIIVYKSNKIKHAFPKHDRGKMQIALLETTPCYIDEKDKRRHVEFIRKPKRFFKRNLFECPLCLGMLT